MKDKDFGPTCKIKTGQARNKSFQAELSKLSPSNAQNDDVLMVQEDKGLTDRMEIEMELDI